jgi:hypothetical protein
MKLTYLDKLFSEFIRKRAMKEVGGCERCKTPKTSYKQLQCSHFHGRRKRSVRFDADNAAGLCAGCHMFFTAHPVEHVNFFIERLGPRDFDCLQARASLLHKVDEAAMALYLRQQIKELDE